MKEGCEGGEGERMGVVRRGRRRMGIVGGGEEEGMDGYAFVGEWRERKGLEGGGLEWTGLHCGGCAENVSTEVRPHFLQAI